MGFEPTNHGFAIRSQSTLSPNASSSSDNDEKNLAFCLALLERKSPDLALLVERWDTLPAPVQAGIVAMVQAAQQ